jgi:hypothetical protein
MVGANQRMAHDPVSLATLTKDALLEIVRSLAGVGSGLTDQEQEHDQEQEFPQAAPGGGIAGDP